MKINDCLKTHIETSHNGVIKIPTEMGQEALDKLEVLEIIKYHPSIAWCANCYGTYENYTKYTSTTNRHSEENFNKVKRWLESGDKEYN